MNIQFEVLLESERVINTWLPCHCCQYPFHNAKRVWLTHDSYITRLSSLRLPRKECGCGDQNMRTCDLFTSYISNVAVDGMLMGF